MANTRKDLEWQMVAVKSIKSLFVATSVGSGYDNVDNRRITGCSSHGGFETTKTEALLNSVNSLEIYGLEKLMVTGRTS